MSLNRSLNALLVLGLALHLRHFHFHLHGPAIDYVGLAAAAFASWVGVPGPGEPVLIAVAVLAAKHHIEMGGVLFVAWLAATAGGIVGWLVGVRAGRALMTAPGPLHKARLSAIARGEKVFERYAPIAIFLAPSWVAGIHRVRTPVYLLWNAVGAAVWAGGIGMGAYLVGPAVIDAVDDLGLVTMLILGAVVAAVIVEEVIRRRRRAARSRPPSSAGEAS